MSSPIRLHNNKPLHTLWGLFRRGPLELELQEDSAVISWEDGIFGGRGRVVIPAPKLTVDELELLARGELPLPVFEEDEGSRLWLTLRRIRSDEKMLPRAVALLEVAFAHHGKPGAFCLERVAEVLHGPRDQLRSRQRQTPVIAELLRFFSCAAFYIDGSQKPSRKARRDTSVYTGVVQGPLLQFRREGRAGTVRLNKGLYDLMTERGATYVEVSSELLSLHIEGHSNPHGNRPTIGQRVRTRLGAVFFARSRQGGKRAGTPLDRVQVEDMLRRFSYLRTDQIQASHRMWSFVDVFREDMAHVAHCGGPVLVGLEQGHTAGESWISLRLPGTVVSGRRERRLAEPIIRERPANTRPPAEATVTGAPVSRGP